MRDQSAGHQKVQPYTAISTTEAEYVAFCSATREAMFLRKLMISFIIPLPSFKTIKAPSAFHLTLQITVR
jgi:hypothetical protein